MKKKTARARDVEMEMAEEDGERRRSNTRTCRHSK